MDKSKILTGAELVSAGASRLLAKLPRTGSKLCAGEPFERAALRGLLRERGLLLALPRLHKRAAVREAAWEEDAVRSGCVRLRPEDALCLMELNRLRVLMAGVVLSMQQARTLLSTPHYSAYADLALRGVALVPLEQGSSERWGVPVRGMVPPIGLLPRYCGLRLSRPPPHLIPHGVPPDNTFGSTLDLWNCDGLKLTESGERESKRRRLDAGDRREPLRVEGARALVRLAVQPGWLSAGGVLLHFSMRDTDTRRNTSRPPKDRILAYSNPVNSDPENFFSPYMSGNLQDYRMSI